jgi:hypothetical protein
MLKSCDNCGKEFLTEADTFVFQNRPSGEYYSCGCVEFNRCAVYIDYRKDCRALKDRELELQGIDPRFPK